MLKQNTRQSIASYRQSLKQAGESVAFVPTMGALHAGHLSLVKFAKAHADRVIVSIFVNPTQFGPAEDLSKYPRTLEQDCAMLEACGVDAVFVPSAEDMFPAGFQTYVENTTLANDLCGKSRPGHFRGVCTVVLKLLQVVSPDLAFFGKKDYQQWRIIEKMVGDLDLKPKVMGCELVRDTDGLALSSRNVFLSPAARGTACLLPEALFTAASLYERGCRSKREILEAAQAVLQRGGDLLAVEYFELRRQHDLRPTPETLSEPGVILAAVRVGGVRLIDNVEFDK